MNTTAEMVYTKEMLLQAFQRNKRKRNFILYKVYESWFSYDLTAETIAARITQDLGFPISKSIVDMTRIRVMKKQMILSENTTIAHNSPTSSIPPKNQKEKSKVTDIFLTPAEALLKDSGGENKTWDFIPRDTKNEPEQREKPKVKATDIFTFQ